MNTRAAFLAAWLCALAALGVGLAFYGALPDPMITHWSGGGVANGYMSKALGIFLIPAIIALVSSLLLLIPRIDPLRANIESFRAQFNVCIVVLAMILALMQCAVIAANLNHAINIVVVAIPAVGMIFFVIGILLPSTKRNYFIGIRTPWTLASDEVWERTHRFGGMLFKALGVIALLSLLAPAYAIYTFIIPVVIALCGLIFYSYVVYREQLID